MYGSYNPYPTVLVHCMMCGKWISDESRHNCDLPTGYRVRRDTSRQEKLQELRDKRGR